MMAHYGEATLYLDGKAFPVQGLQYRSVDSSDHPAEARQPATGSFKISATVEGGDFREIVKALVGDPLDLRARAMGLDPAKVRATSYWRRRYAWVRRRARQQERRGIFRIRAHAIDITDRGVVATLMPHGRVQSIPITIGFAPPVQ